jgi:hypothetical protein
MNPQTASANSFDERSAISTLPEDQTGLYASIRPVSEPLAQVRRSRKAVTR